MQHRSSLAFSRQLSALSFQFPFQRNHNNPEAVLADG
jgi:hypothetical protein